MEMKNARRGETQKNNNAVHKNCHSRGMLSGISLIPSRCSDLIKVNALCYNNREAGDPQLRPLGMTSLFNTPLPRFAVLSPQGGQKPARGFTLIELLVVVLIIGLLAAVALPQYNKAVKKAQGAEALNSLYALNQALSVYYLDHGTYLGADVDKLEVEIPESKTIRYAVGSDVSYESTSAKLQSGMLHSRITGSGTPAVVVNMLAPGKKFYLSAQWEANQKKPEIKCYDLEDKTESAVNCKSYFQVKCKLVFPGCTGPGCVSCYINK